MNITSEVGVRKSVHIIHNLEPGTSYCVIVKGRFKDDNFTSKPNVFTTIHNSKYKSNFQVMLVVTNINGFR